MSAELAAFPSNEISIDPGTGALSVGSAMTLAPHGSLPPFETPLAITRRPPRDMRTGYFWHDFEGASFAGRPCIIRACVLQDRVVHICLDFLRTEASGPLWHDQAEVTRQIAMARFAFCGMLERSFATGSERFPWGIAYAVYDDKSGGVPGIGLRYDL
jgi:hypothetical protein